MQFDHLNESNELTTVVDKFSWDTSQPSRKCPSSSPPHLPLSMLFSGIILTNLVNQH